VKRERAEFLVQLQRQLTWLKRSAASYDRGNVDEALRMSAPLRTLLYDKGGSSVSILTHLGIKKTVRLLSTATPARAGAAAWAGITSLRIGENFSYADYVPKLAGAEVVRNVPFREWWHDEVIYINPAGAKVSRSDIVLWAAHKDGGAHVDDIVPETYRWLEEGAGWSITMTPDDGPPRVIQFENAHLSALRQMTF
jgi:hypothetical protein